MATPAVTRAFIPGSSRNSRKTMKLPPRFEMISDSPALRAEQCLVPNQTGKGLHVLDGTKESPPEVPNKSRRTLMSPQECQVAQCSPNQLERTINSLLWLQSNGPFQIIQDDWLGFLWATPEIPSDTRLKSIGTPISA